MNAIEISGLKKQFPKSGFLLDLPRLAVQEGYITGFIGENGAGKTTTLKLLMDLLFPDEGQLRLLGLDAHAQGVQARRQVGYVGETPGYLEGSRLGQLVRMTRPFYPTWDQERFLGYVRRFGLRLESRYRDLSKGQRKQFALAMALSHHPRLLLLDEPTANLDPLVRQDILDILAEELEQEGITVFFSTHITSDLDKIADYLVFLHRGRLLLEGEREALLQARRLVKARRELYTPEVAALLVEAQVGEFGFTGMTEHPRAVYELLGEEALYETPTVEDLFLAYTRRDREVAA